MTDWPVLASLSPGERTALLRTGRPRRYAPGEVILRYGDPAECLHLVSSGRASIGLPTSDGEQMIFRVIGEGSSIGEQAALEEAGDWAVTVVAMEACETICLRRAQLRELLSRRPDVSECLMASMAEQLHGAYDRLVELAFVPTSRRVHRRLLSLQAEFGDETIVVTQRDLASMAGATRATVNSILRDLERCGIVRSGRGRMRVLDAAALARRAGLGEQNRDS